MREMARPFFKWAGGKQQLLQQFESHFPYSFERYFEPFVGSGAVFFYLHNSGRLNGQAALFDHNRELINAYRVVRDRLQELMEHLAMHQERHSRDYYYHIRGLDRSQEIELSDVERAARTIYLNKTCYNGLYRVNSKGQFNVPMGRYKNPKILDRDSLSAAHAALQGVRVEARGFRTIIELVRAGDFIYFDPPYQPVSRTASFTSYTAGDFCEKDQRDLAALYRALSDEGCLCMLSNSYTPFVLELYQGFRIETVQATRAINSNADGRGKVKEVLVLNY